MGIHVGIDASEAGLDVAARPGGEARRLPNDEGGAEGLVGRLGEMRPSLVAPGSSGGHERTVVAALAAAALPVAVVSPGQARGFARATGELAEADKLDAQALAHEGSAARPEVRPAPGEQAREFAANIARRRRVVGMLAAEGNGLEASASPVRERIEAHVEFLEAELSDLDGDLDRAIRESPLRREEGGLLRGVPGVGPKVSATLPANLPGLGALGDKKLAAPAGAAPLNRGSGVSRGRRRARGGRAGARRMLYMAAVAAARCNPVFKEPYGRLPAALNSMLRHGTRWRRRQAAQAA